MSLEKISHDADTIAQTAQIVIDRLQEQNAKLVAAIQRIDAINDNPAIFNKDIDDVCTAALLNR